MSRNVASRRHGCSNEVVLMVNWKRFLFLILLAGFVVACDVGKKISVPVESVESERAVKNRSANKLAVKKAMNKKKSVVYVYRPARVANVMLVPDLNIAGVEKMVMGNGSCRKVYLPPGTYAVRLQAIKGNTEAVEHELKVVKGKASYLRVDASMKFEVGQTYQPYQRRFELTDVPAKQARSEISACAEADVVEKKKPGGKAEKKDDASFSVDKTQNPFSH
ncbi:MAG: DUF2846 domain-containing protein [Gammaproteobacteria bacterium]|nr:DUF2846 domain-containing protein [Gammaproteobacteria bacterium]